MRRTQNLTLQLDALAERGAIIVERFDAYDARALRTWHEVDQQLRSMESAATQMGFLREQIELRALGLGWNELCVPWTQNSDANMEASIARLRSHLRERVLPIEAQRTRDGLIPTEAPLPDFKAKSYKQLGSATTELN